MATIPFPTADFTSVQVERLKASALVQSPFTYAQKVYRYPGALWIATFTCPPMTDGGTPDAGTWTSFLDDMDGHENTTTVDLSDYAPDISGVTSLSMRLASNSAGWSRDVRGHFTLSFTLIEAV